MAPVSSARGQLNHYFRGPRAAQQLASDDPDERAEGARFLGHYGSPETAVRALVAALDTEPEFIVRVAILRSLLIRADPRAVEGLTIALQRGGGPARFMAAAALGRIGTPAAMQSLVDALGSEDTAPHAADALLQMDSSVAPFVRARVRNDSVGTAAEILGALQDVEAVPTLISLLPSARGASRRRIVEALGAIGDPRAADPLVALLPSSNQFGDAEIVLRALETTAHSPEHVLAIQGFLAHDSLPVRSAALRSLCATDVAACMPSLTAAVSSDDPRWVRSAAELALQSTHSAMLPIHYGLLREGTLADQAASALAEVQDGAGLGILAEELANESPHVSSLRRAVAVALRKWSSRLPRSVRRKAIRLLRDGSTESPRDQLLLALAGDRSIDDRLRADLESENPARRGWAAWGMELRSDSTFCGDLREALLGETNPEAYRRIASAMIALSASLDPELVSSRHLTDPEIGPEAVRLIAHSFDRLSAWRQTHLRRFFRSTLRDGSTRMQVAAAHALAIVGDRAAWRALVAATESVSVEVRHAAARALRVLGVREAAPMLESLAWLEEDPRVRRELRDAARAPRQRRLSRLEASGQEVLRLKVARDSPNDFEDGVLVDLLLPDSRWLRLRTLPTGEIFLADLPAGEADLRILELARP